MFILQEEKPVVAMQLQKPVGNEKPEIQNTLG